MIPIHHAIVENDDVEALGDHATREIEQSVRREIFSERTRCGRRPAHGGVIHAHRIGRGPQPQHLDRRHAARFADAEIRHAERQHAVVVDDGQRRVDQPRRHSRRQTAENQIHGLGRVGDKVIENRHREGPGRRIVVRPIQRAVDRTEIHSGQSRTTARRRVIHRHRPQTAVGPKHRDHRQIGVFRDREIRQTEAHDAAPELIVHNGQHRVRAPGQHDGHRRRKIGRAKQPEVHRAIGVRDRVIDDPDRERLAPGFPIAPRQRALRVRVTRIAHRTTPKIRHRRPARRSQVLHRHRAHRSAEAVHRNENPPARNILDHRVADRAEVQQHVIIENRQRRHRRRPNRRARRAAQRERHRAIPVDYQVIGNPNLENARDFARRKSQPAARRGVIPARPRGAIARRVHHRRHSLAAADAAHRDRGVGLILGERVIHVRKLQAARPEIVAAQNAREPVARQAVEQRERARNVDLPIGLRRDREHGIIRAESEIHRRVHRALRGQPRQVITPDGVEIRERAADQNPPVRLHHQRQHVVVRARRRDIQKRRVQRAIDIETRQVITRDAVGLGERAADHDLAVRLHRERAHRAVIRAARRIKRRVQTAIRIQTRDPHPVRVVHHREFTADHHLAIRLHRHREHRPVHTRSRIGQRVHRPVRVQHHEVRARHAVERCERTAQRDLAIRPHRRRENRIVRPRPGVEGRIQRTIRVQPREVISVRAVVGRETPADHELLIERLQRHRQDHRIRAGARLELRVHAAVGIQPRDAIDRQAAVGREFTADDELAPGLQRQRVDRAIRPERRVERRVQRTRRRDERLIIENRQRRIREPPRRRLAEIRQHDRHRPIRLREQIVDDRNQNVRRRLAIRENERPRAIEIVLPRHCRPRLREVLHRDLLRIAAHAIHRDHRRPAIFRDEIRRFGKRDLPVRIRVDDRANRVAQIAVIGPAGNVRQPQPEHLHPFHQTILRNRHRDRLIHDARRENHVRVDRTIVQTSARVAGRERKIKRLHIHLHTPDAAARAAHIHRQRAVGLVHGEIVRGETQAAKTARPKLIIHDQQHRVGQAQLRAARGIRERQQHRLLELRRDVIDDRNRERAARLPRREQQRAAAREIIHIRRRRPRRGRVLHRHRARRTVRADNRDRRVAHRFADLEHRPQKSEHAHREIVVDDRHRRRRLETQRRPRRRGRRTGTRIRQREAERAVAIGNCIVDQ